MPDLSVSVCGMEAAHKAVAFEIQIGNRPHAEVIESISLRCQIQIEAPRRKYTEAEKARLFDLFGEPERWGQTLRPILWANLSTGVPRFTDSVRTVIDVPWTSDPDAATSKYFGALTAGTIPVTILFSGTVFYTASNGQLQIAPVPWSLEARSMFPVELWSQVALKAGA